MHSTGNQTYTHQWTMSSGRQAYVTQKRPLMNARYAFISAYSCILLNVLRSSLMQVRVAGQEARCAHGLPGIQGRIIHALSISSSRCCQQALPATATTAALGHATWNAYHSRALPVGCQVQQQAVCFVVAGCDGNLLVIFACFGCKR